MKKLRLNDLTLDEVSWEVKRGDKEISLSFIEFIILKELLSNAGEAITRTRLMNAIQVGCDKYKKNKKIIKEYYEDSNIIDVYISYLRKKIDKRSKVKLIYTIRDIGYKMQDKS